MPERRWAAVKETFFKPGQTWRNGLCDIVQQNRRDRFQPKLRVQVTLVDGQPRRPIQVMRPVGEAIWLAPHRLIVDGEPGPFDNAGLEEIELPIEVRPEDVRRLTFGSTYEERNGADVRTRRFIPPEAYDTTGLFSGTKVLAVKVGSDPYGALFPAWTIANHYLFASTRLSKAILNGDLYAKPDEFYEVSTARFLTPQEELEEGLRSPAFQIKIRPGVNEQEAYILAQYASSDDGSVTRKAFCRPHLSWRAEVNNGQRSATIDADFPFVGKTTLIVYGRRFTAVNEQGERVERIFVVRIVNCTAPFNFRDLMLIKEETEIQPPREGVTLPVVPRRELPPGEGAIEVDGESGPDNSVRARLERTGSLLGRFSALRDCRVKKKRVRRSAEARSKFEKVDGEEIRGGSTGTLGQTGSNIQPIDIVPDPDQVDPPDANTALDIVGKVSAIDGFIALIDAVKQGLPGTVASSLTILPPPYNYGGYTFGSVGEMPERTGIRKRVGTWQNISVPVPGAPDQIVERPRLLLAASLTYHGRRIYLFDIEAKLGETFTSVMAAYSGNRGLILDEELQLIRQVARLHRRLWSHSTMCKDLKSDIEPLARLTFVSYSHGSNGAAVVAPRIVELLKASGAPSFARTADTPKTGSSPN